MMVNKNIHRSVFLLLIAFLVFGAVAQFVYSAEQACGVDDYSCSGGGGTSCTNECSTSGTTVCLTSTSYHTCGNYDSDSCLEWGSTYSCDSGYECLNGQCVIIQTTPSCVNLGGYCDTNSDCCEYGETPFIMCSGVGKCSPCGDGDKNYGEACDPNNPYGWECAADCSGYIGNSGTCDDGIIQNPNRDGFPETCDTNPGEECPLSAPYDYDTSNGIISCKYCASNCGGWITKEAGYCGDGEWQEIYEDCEGTQGVGPNEECNSNCDLIGICESTCFNPGQKQCSGNTVQTCDYNNDGCTEWGNTQTCNSPQLCSSGQCITPDPGCPQTKDCSGLECGTDPVCGESCGTCQTGYTCQSGNCVQNPAPEYCGDGICNNGETCSSCSADCGTCLPVNCELTFAVWSAESVTENEQVQLIVNGNNCDGVTVAFEVYEDDLLGDDPANIQPNNAIFSSGVAIGTWTAEWQEDVTGDPEYYFRASTNPTIKSSDPLLITTQDTSYCITTPVDLCSDYTSLGQSKCELDSCGAIENSIPEGVDCEAEGVDCACTWRWETSECSASYSSGEIGTCYLRETGQADNCDDGFLSYSWTADWEWAIGNFLSEDPESENYIYDSEAQGWRYDPINPFKGYRKSEQCVEGSNIIACPAQIQLSFFDKYNFLVAIVLIVLIYLIIEAVNRNKKVKKKRVSRRKKK